MNRITRITFLLSVISVLIAVVCTPVNGKAATPSITSLSPTSGAVGAAVTITGTNFGSTQGSSTVKFNGTTASSITSWSATSIVAVVPSGATTGNVVVTVSSLASNGVSFTVVSAPSITSLSPTSGAVSASVTITGTNFGSTQGTSTVAFNGTTATTITSWSATSIVAKVPTGATTGNVVVHASGVNSNGVSFTVLATPSITSLSPTSGAVGAAVTITGTNFGSTQGSSTVKFNGTTASSITSWSATSIVAVVPSGATTGNVVVTVSSLASNGVSFTVVSAPSITSLSPTSGAVSASVTITGTNFGSTQGTSTVAFNGTTATTITSWSATSIVAKVPTGATTGNVVVHASGVNSNGVSFTVLATPSITSLSPTSGAVGAAVTITGTNFGSTQGSSTVKFNGTTASSITSWSATSIVAVVPSGATTGNVVVTVSSLASNGVSFTVVSAPSITSLSPTSGAVSASVTITGTNFGSTQGTSTVAFNGTTATTITSWSATSIVAKVPTGATTGNVVVHASGVNSNGVSFTVLATPSITSLSPTSGAVGAAVTITGTNFGSTQGSSTVKFNGTTASSITSWSATSIVAVVPSGATTGNVVVTVSSLASNGVSFTVVSAPSITSLSPTSGAVSASVTITGTNFGSTQGTSTVAFNGTTATTITSWSATSIVAKVPTGATTGNVVVHASGVNSNGVSFTVLATPSITSLSPTSGAVGAAVTITGTNFGSTQGSSTVKFNGTTASSITSWSATSIVAVVPSGATTGNVVVTVSSLASNGVSFTVLAGLAVTTDVLPKAAAGLDYDTTLQSGSGTAPYTWSIVSGSLPAGLSLVPGTGEISGTPTTTGTGSFTVQVQDNSGNVATKALLIPVGGAVSGRAVSSTACDNSNPSVSSLSCGVAYTDGNIVGCAVSIAGNVQVSSVTDNASPANTYSQAALFYWSSGPRLEMWISNFNAGPATAVTVNLASGTQFSVSCDTLVGIDGWGDAANANYGTSTSPNVSVTTVANSDWVLAGLVAKGSGAVTNMDVSTATTGPSASDVGGGIETVYQATAGSTAINANLSASEMWAIYGIELSASEPPPVISSINPISGPPGTNLTVIGSNFLDAGSLGSIAINGVVVSPTSWSDSSITLTVPANVTSGPVSVTAGGNVSNAVNFAVVTVPVQPTISPASGTYGGPQFVTITDPPSNAPIYYTVTSGTTGTTPTTSSTLYQTGSVITVGSTETIEAIAAEPGYPSSTVATATYNFAAVAPSNIALTVTSGGNPVSTISAGTAVTLTATVTSGATKIPTGTVDFCDATATHCTDIHILGTAQLDSGGTATINLTPSIGAHSYNAIFAGTSSYPTSTSNVASLTVTTSNGYPTATNVAAVSAWNGYNVSTQVVGLNSNVVSPTGTVSILDASNGNALLGTAALAPSGYGVDFVSASNLSFPAQFADMSNKVFGVGDFNGDGKPDLAVVNGNYISIMLGNGDGTFTQALGSPINLGADGLDLGQFSDGYGVAVGDFNGDGVLDLAVAASSASDSYIDSITILKGNGDGTFTVGNSFSTCSSISASPAVGDFNKDGKLDLAIVCAPILGNGVNSVVTIWLGNGDGTFVPSAGSPIVVGSESTTPDFIVAGDFNGDGIPDLAVANEGTSSNGVPGSSTITILLANGDGTFTEPSTSPVATVPEPMALAVADFSGSGNLDLAVVDYYYGQVAVLQNDGLGNFTAPYIVDVGNGPYSAVVGDFNHDGIPDLAVANNYDNTVTYLFEYREEQGGTFYFQNQTVTVSNSPSTTTTLGSYNYDGPESLAVGDFNGDGTADLAIGVAGTSANPSTTYIMQSDAGEIATATLTGIVPLGFGTHNIVASYGGDPNYAASSTVIPLTAGIAISPNTGGCGASVTITGNGFGNSQGSSTVTVGGIAANVSAWSNTQIQAQIPNGLETGPQSVVVTEGSQTASGTFIVFAWITGITPPSALPGSSVTISGSSFGAAQNGGILTFNGTVATVSSWSDTSILATVPSGATTGNVIVNAGGGNSNGWPFTVLSIPTISSLSPVSGAVGALVTITGTNFGASQGTSTVTFNGTAATVSSWSATSITAVVPAGATTGNVIVTVSGVSSSGTAFTVLPTPTISVLSPTSGAVGSSVTITGTNFGASQGASTITFNGIAAAISSWSATSITAVVPAGATTGSAVVTVSGIASNGVMFTVLVPPVISSLSPTSGVVGALVIITGTNFGASQGTSTVTFNGTAATVSSWSATSITAAVPSGTTTGNVVVTVSGLASNGEAFTVLSIALMSSANPSSYGGSVTFTATFSFSGSTGSVTFMDSGTQIGTGAITGTTATFKTSSLAIGQHSITASWAGNSSYPALTSSPLPQNVLNTPAITAWPWPSAITYGQTLASSELIGGSASVSGTFEWTSPSTIPSVGTPSESLTFTPSDTTDYSSVTGSVAVTVDPAGSSTSSSSVSYTYDSQGRLYQAQYNTPNGTITVTYSYDSAGNRTSVVTQ